MQLPLQACMYAYIYATKKGGKKLPKLHIVNSQCSPTSQLQMVFHKPHTKTHVYNAYKNFQVPYNLGLLAYATCTIQLSLLHVIGLMLFATSFILVTSSFRNDNFIDPFLIMITTTL